MTFDGLLTFITLLIAALAFLPPIVRLRMRVILARWIVLSALGLIAVLYFEFFRITALGCPSWLGNWCGPLTKIVAVDTKDGALLEGREMAFLVVAVWMAVVWVLLRGRTAPTHAYKKLLAATNRLFIDRRYADLIDLVEPNLPALVRAANRDFRIQRWNDALRQAPRGNLDFMVTIVGGELTIPPKPTFRQKLGKWRKGIRLKVGTWLANHLPDGRAYEEKASAILGAVTGHRSLREHIVVTRAAFGAKLMSMEHHLAEDFTKLFLTEMMGRPGSALYNEISASQNCSSLGFRLAPDAVILHALLDDVQVSTRIGGESAIAERALANLEADNGDGYAASLNRSPDIHFDQFGKWEDPTFIAICFFEIMVPAAAVQGTDWHMSLTYMRNFVKSLVEHYDESGPDIDPLREWPTRGAYFLYQIFAQVRDWIELAEKLPKDSIHREPESDRVDWDNGHIPKTAALVLGECLATVMRSQAISDRFKGYLFDIALRSVKNMAPGGELAKLRRATLGSIAQGGVSDAGETYRATLRRLYSDIDHIARAKLRDFEPMVGWPPAPKPVPRSAAPPPRPRWRDYFADWLRRR